MKNEVLPEFQNYLRSNSLVQEKYIPFYACSARKKNYKLSAVSVKLKTKKE